MASFCNNPCINLKVLNTYKRPLNQVEWSLTFYDTNGLRVVTIADSSWRTFHPKRETDESLELRFSVEEYDLKRYQYRCEVTPGSARVAY
jgi:hypothetical protein